MPDKITPPIIEDARNVLKGVIKREKAMIRHEQIENLVADALAQYENAGYIEVDTHLKLKTLINSEA